MFENNRILIVDDNESIHEDFKKILSSNVSQKESDYQSLEEELFGFTNSSTITMTDFRYQLDFAFQGQEAYEMVKEAEKNCKPYALIFMDVRMPPGWDGIETISKIWESFPNIEVVICSAYSDYSWDKIISKLGSNDRLLFLKKPFDAVEVKQMALALIKKWNLHEKSKHYVDDLERDVAKRTKQLKSMVQELINSRDKLKHEVFIRKQAEVELASEKENLSVTLKSIKDAVIAINTEGNITLINKMAEDFLGVVQEEVINKPLNEFLHLTNLDNEKIEICLKENLEKGQISNCDDETVLLLSKNKIHTVSINSSPILDKNNSFTGSVVLIRDVSEKMKMKEELIRAKKLDSVATFAGGIAHDFNNILTGIIGNITLARMVIDDNGKAFEYLDTAENESIKASKLSQQLLSFSKGSLEKKDEVNKDIIHATDKTKLLLFDDNSVNNILQKLIEELGYHAEISSTESKFLLNLNDNNFSAIIADLNFIEKNLNSLEDNFIKKIKENHPEIKIIVSSNFPTDYVQKVFKNIKADGFISKPFRFNDLKEILDKLVPLQII